MADARLQLFFLPIADCRSFAGKDEIDVIASIVPVPADGSARTNSGGDDFPVFPIYILADISPVPPFIPGTLCSSIFPKSIRMFTSFSKHCRYAVFYDCGDIRLRLFAAGIPPML